MSTATQSINKNKALGNISEQKEGRLVNILPLCRQRIRKGAQLALPCVVQWIEYWSANQRVTGLIPNQGTCLGYGPGPQWGST